MKSFMPLQLNDDRDEIQAFHYMIDQFRCLLDDIRQEHGESNRVKALDAMAKFLHHARMEGAPIDQLVDSVGMLLWNFADMLCDEAAEALVPYASSRALFSARRA